jgi:DNA-directed RNA polymerase specialized sigma24 family protein
MWLLQYAYTRAINRHYHLKQRHFYSKVNVDEIKPLEYSTARAGDRWLTAPEASRYVMQALNQLKPSEREAIQLIAIEGLTLQEAAHKLDQTLPKTRHDYYRGIVKLQQILVPGDEEERRGLSIDQSLVSERGPRRKGVENYIQSTAPRAV